MIWRYDPILFTDRYTMDYHITFFRQLARRLEGYTHKCIISFVDLYRNTQTNMDGLGFAPLTEKEIMNWHSGWPVSRADTTLCWKPARNK